MNSIKIALLQMTALGTECAASVAKGELFCRRAAAMGADAALFPEMWNIGYTPCPSDTDGRAAWCALAVPQQSEYVTHFTVLARELDLAIALTYLECRGEAVRNSVSLIDRHGQILFTYSSPHVRVGLGSGAGTRRGFLRRRARYARRAGQGWRDDLP